MKIRRHLIAPALFLAAAVASPNLSPAADPPPPIARASLEVNLAAARDAYPGFAESCKRLIDSSSPPEENPAAEKGRQFAIKFMDDFITKVNTLSYSVTWDKDNLTFASAVSPTYMPGKREFPKPNLPADAVFTAHVVYPTADSEKWVDKLMALVDDTDLPFNGANVTPAQLADERKALADLVSLFLAADSESLSVQNVNGKIIVTLLTQYDHDINVPAQLQADLSTLRDLAKAQGAPDLPFSIENVSPSDGSAGIHLTPTATSDGDPTGIFITQKDHAAEFTFSFAPNPAPTAIDLSTTDKISNLLAAHTDLAAVFTLMQSDPDFADLPPDLQQKVTQLFAGKSLDIAGYNDGDTLRFSATVPVDVIHAFMIIGNPPPPPGDNPPPPPPPAPAAQ